MALPRGCSKLSGRHSRPPVRTLAPRKRCNPSAISVLPTCLADDLAEPDVDPRNRFMSRNAASEPAEHVRKPEIQQIVPDAGGCLEACANRAQPRGAPPRMRSVHLIEVAS